MTRQLTDDERAVFAAAAALAADLREYANTDTDRALFEVQYNAAYLARPGDPKGTDR